jgi:hypothetical protein
MITLSEELSEKIQKTQAENKQRYKNGYNWYTLRKMDNKEHAKLWEEVKMTIDTLSNKYNDIIDKKLKTAPEKVIYTAREHGKHFIYKFTIKGFECELEVFKHKDVTKNDIARYIAFNPQANQTYIRDIQNIKL